METRGLSASRLALDLGMPPSRVIDAMKNRRSNTAELAKDKADCSWLWGR